MIERLKLENILSFRDADIKLEQLNIIIGGNGAGKSNLLRAIGLLQHLPNNLRDAGTAVGGFSEFFCKLEGAPETLSIHTDLALVSSESERLTHSLVLAKQQLSFAIVEERLIGQTADRLQPPAVHFEVKGGHASVRTGKRKPKLRLTPDDWNAPRPRPTFARESLARERYDVQNSLLQQTKGPSVIQEIISTQKQLSEIRIYGRWDTTPDGSIRRPKSANLEGGYLQADGGNLPLVFNMLEAGPAGDQIEHWLRKFNPRIKRVRAVVFGGQVQLYFTEEHQKEAIAATGVSDGTLQFLLLLCVLLHPNPPPLICLEEPEIALHPDAIRMLAQLLREASERTQVIVTTHSDRLIDCFTETPEVVLVAERNPVTGETTLERKDQPALKAFMTQFKLGLGAVWRSGHIGGGIY